MADEEHDTDSIKARGGPCGAKCKVRYILAILASVGMGLIYGMKVGLHVVIVAMVNYTAIQSHQETSNQTTASPCGTTDKGQDTEKMVDGPFAWAPDVQGLLLSSYFFGYLVAELPGGYIAEKFSAKWVFFFAVAINIVCLFLSPTMSKLHYGALLAMRVLQGIGGGVTFPACHVLLAHWAPPNERSLISSIVYAGTALGTVIFMLLSGVIASNIGWEEVFYIEGGFSSVWLFFWAFFIADSPRKQPRISEEERAFIRDSLHEKPGKQVHPPMPWKAAFTSSAFLAILVAHTCSNWGWYMVLIELPQYMTNVLHFKIAENAGLSAMPFFIMWLFSLALGRILDALISKKRLTITRARKVATLIASVIPTICFIALCLLECNRGVAVGLMTLAVTSIGGMFSGFLSNHIDIAPNHAGTLMAITNTFATVPGIVVPIIVGQLTHSDPSIHSWRIVFYITICLYAVEIVVYTIWGSGEVQPWNEPKPEQPERQAADTQQ